MEPLTARETEVLALMAKGYSHRRIAATLTIGYKTVRTHANSIYAKLHVEGRTEAVTKSHMLGLINLSKLSQAAQAIALIERTHPGAIVECIEAGIIHD